MSKLTIDNKKEHGPNCDGKCPDDIYVLDVQGITMAVAEMVKKSLPKNRRNEKIGILLSTDNLTHKPEALVLIGEKARNAYLEALKEKIPDLANLFKTAEESPGKTILDENLSQHEGMPIGKGGNA